VSRRRVPGGESPGWLPTASLGRSVVLRVGLQIVVFLVGVDHGRADLAEPENGREGAAPGD
jgi:hypothetical protein